MQEFKLPDGFTIECKSEKTRYGFRHLAKMFDDKHTLVAQSKACYYNRTWESYTFQSVVHSAIRNYFKHAQHASEDDPRIQAYYACADGRGRDADMAPFRATGMMDALAKLFSEDGDLATRNKMRMASLKAHLPEIDLSPLEGLPEEEKAKRLDQAIAITKEGI